MLTALVISMIFNIIFAAYGVVATVIALRFFGFASRFEEKINTCLDILNEAYGQVGTLLDRPLLIDSPEVRQIMGILRNAHDAILVVANEISKQDDAKADDKDDDQGS